MCRFQILQHFGWAALLFLVAGLGSLLPSTAAQAVTPVDADLAFSSFFVKWANFLGVGLTTLA